MDAWENGKQAVDTWQIRQLTAAPLTQGRPAPLAANALRRKHRLCHEPGHPLEHA